MTSKWHHKRVIRQPAREAPVYARETERPLLDWGDEEPDTFWERLYYSGRVSPPYRSSKDRKELMAELTAAWEPIGQPMTNEELMCALGRCHCERCA